MIRKITNEVEVLRSTYSQVFGSFDPFDPVIRLENYCSTILYPTDSYLLTGLQYFSWMQSVVSFGDSNFFVSEIESNKDPFLTGSHWKCEQPSYDEYKKLEISVECAIYSTASTWGIMVSHEDHAVLACKSELWTEFSNRYAKCKKDFVAFKAYWGELEREGVPVAWFEKLLMSVSEK